MISQGQFTNDISSRLMRQLAALICCVLIGVSGAVSAQEYTVNLKDADIQEFIKFVAEVTDTTIVVDPRVTGKVRVVSNKPVRSAELYDLFLSILEVHGYTAVRTGSVVRVIQSKDARSSSVPVEDAAGGSVPGEYITQVIRLNNISAAKLIPVLRPLVPQQAHMAAYPPSNAIILSDVAANVDRIRAIIERMDSSAKAQTEVFKLRFADADEVVRLLESLNKARQAGTEEASETMIVADRRSNSVVVSADEMERARIGRMIEHLDTPLERSGNVRVVYLQYAKAEDVAAVLTRVMQNMSRMDTQREGSAGRSEVTIEADDATNSLIITAAPDKMAALDAVIHRLDIRRAQVLVEAIIVEMEMIDGQDLGLQWLFSNNSGAFGSNITENDTRVGRIGAAVLPAEGGGGDVNVGRLAEALAGTAGATLGWGRLDEDLSIAVILNALRAQQNANILSTPSLLTLDNQQAFITVGQNVPFVTGSFTNTGGVANPINPFQTIERQNVGVTLTVTPRVNDGDTVVLEIEQEVSSLSGGLNVGASDLITNERRIQTRVLVGDGRTVVLGGLMSDDVQEGTQKVPLLGDLPLLGRLFRSDAVSVTKSNLLIFIKPTIIRDEVRLHGATAEKYQAIRAQQEARRERGLIFLDDQLLPVLPEWQDDLEALRRLRDEAAAEVEGGG